MVKPATTAVRGPMKNASCPPASRKTNDRKKPECRQSRVTPTLRGGERKNEMLRTSILFHSATVHRVHVLCYDNIISSSLSSLFATRMYLKSHRTAETCPRALFRGVRALTREARWFQWPRLENLPVIQRCPLFRGIRKECVDNTSYYF